LTPFCFGLEDSIEPTAIYEFEMNREPCNLSLLYDMLSRKHGRLFAVLGLGLFDRIHGSAVKLAPVFNESIVDPKNLDKYFHNLEPSYNRVGIFIGVINNPTKQLPLGYDTAFEGRVFYVNPADKGDTGLRTHTHILVTSSVSIPPGTGASYGDVLRIARNVQVVDVYHLLTQSTLKKAVVVVFEISRTTAMSKAASSSTLTKNIHLSVGPLISDWAYMQCFNAQKELGDYTRGTLRCMPARPEPEVMRGLGMIQP
jgi:hypothetical protein